MRSKSNLATIIAGQIHRLPEPGLLNCFKVKFAVKKCNCVSHADDLIA